MKPFYVMYILYVKSKLLWLSHKYSLMVLCACFLEEYGIQISDISGENASVGYFKNYCLSLGSHWVRYRN